MFLSRPLRGFVSRAGVCCRYKFSGADTSLNRVKLTGKGFGEKETSVQWEQSGGFWQRGLVVTNMDIRGFFGGTGAQGTKRTAAGRISISSGD